ncbi:hypothetical protein DV532_26620 (plasmid) [Pseudomonas sp. Leaf58]|uniref:hypothetical protein n=1 Tax=Pseudomonas sp. Leaf58 TaxID=1736226 RepID=UPI0006F29662|nr:hypothetical protein [Pseudomonas sp. Leaf58]AYG47861.1 hypothetical protein DV532_26620 [Pseudomonas sp. Leaf58]KQN62574.1 hypothetical protein ASF02_10535 [Pseudomonas sp. Leaf58]
MNTIQDLFISLTDLNFQTKRASRGELAENSQALMGRIFVVFGGIDPVLDAIALEPEERAEKLSAGLFAAIRWALQHEGLYFREILAWAYQDAVAEEHRLLSPVRLSQIKERLGTTSFGTTSLQKHYLFSDDSTLRYPAKEYCAFFEGRVTDDLAFAYHKKSDHFEWQFAELKDSLGETLFASLKSSILRVAIEDHLAVNDPRFALLFEGEQDSALISERMAEVVKDLSDPIVIEYALNITDKLIQHIQATEVGQDSVVAAFVHHLDFEANIDLGFSLEFHFQPASHFIQKLRTTGIDFNPVFTGLLGMPAETTPTALVEAVAERLPQIPNTQYLKKQDVWLGAFIDAYPVDQLLAMELDSKTTSRLYRIKGDTRLRDKTTDPDYLADLLAQDMGL